MRAEERDAILRQGVVRPETPRDRRRRESLEEDIRASPARGRRVEVRLRNFVPTADGYLASLHGPLPFMTRLREIEAMTAAHEDDLEEAWHELAETVEDDDVFADRWREIVGRWSFDEVNDLVARHNRWYPVESRLPMDPRTGDFALVNGRSYRRSPLDADWALARLPPDRRAPRETTTSVPAQRRPQRP